MIIYKYSINGRARYFTDNQKGWTHLLEITGSHNARQLGQWENFSLNRYLYGYQQ